MISTRSRLARLLPVLDVLLFAALCITFGMSEAPAEENEPLSADSSIGRIIDREGNGSLKPVAADRWAVAEENLPLLAGDWLKTGSRGANALQLKMKNGAVYILGPDTLVEAVDGETLKVIAGEVEVTTPAKVSVTVQGPAGSLLVSGKKVLRARDGQLTTLEQEPRWLVGYKSDASTEALGSLLANVDGRNVPLTMGYHKVVVDIRDQIARTDIEESFINHTSSVLEGVFYFPLPQDASISGFGMWIGDEYVHGEIVEKERAREIYETILREKRDPGLLEWTGGNIFKARVYPIGGEKRIRITYTQVLPKVGNTYRYNYALQSEMLRQHPLKQLKIEVKLNSVERLVAVESPSHACRVRRTEHSASVEYDEEECTPTRDFELRIGTAPSERRVTMIPHRRGDDGYFMLLLAAPGGDGNVDRPLLTNSPPLNLTLVADTSGSMMGPQRHTQIAFLEALLGSLGAKDRFNVVTSDVETRWAFAESVENTEANRAAALEFVEKRAPLGWSDLDRTFGEVMQRVKADGQVVYVGDGLPTSGDADPVAFSQRLQKMYGGAGTFHAVAPGSGFEGVVLRAMASLGGGSVREIGGGTDPAQTAFQLLREISAPAVKNLKIQFRGVAAAAVYPESLPNLPAGSQQIVIGRYDPSGGDRTGTVTVTGLMDGKPVEYSEEIKLAGAEEGNSFIPRLWARHHLDHLLAQGTTQQVKDRIIALSEDFQIITPYTSFLVLESEADRERFKVKKQFRMRDGEEFFAEGRDNANFDLVRQQMLAAKTYRKRIREALLARLAEMERDRTRDLLREPGDPWELSQTASFGGYFERGAVAPGSESRRDLGDEARRSEDNENKPAAPEDGESMDSPEGEPGPVLDDSAESPEMDGDRPAREMEKKREEVLDRLGKSKDARGRNVYPYESAAGLKADKISYGGRGRYNARGPYDYLNALFPSIPGPRASAPEPAWTKEVLELVRSLDRRQRIAAMENGLHFTVRSSGLDARNRKQNYGTGESWLSAESWLTISMHVAGNDSHTQWLTAEERGILSAAWMLGRTRAREDGDAAGWDAPFGWYFNEFVTSYHAAGIALEKLNDGRISLTMSWPGSPDSRTVVIVDPAKSAVVEIRSYSVEELQSTTRFTDLVEAGGAWWPTRITTSDRAGKEVSTMTIEVRELARADFDASVAKIVERKKDAIMLGKAPEKLDAARQAVQDGKATLEDLWAVLAVHAARQDWAKAKPVAEALAERVKGKLGLTPIRLALLQGSRQNEELKKLLQEATAALAAAPREADYAAAWQLLNYAGYLNAGNERMALIQALKPVCERQKEIFEPMLQWDRQWLYALQNMEGPEEFFRQQKALAARYPFQLDLQTSFANSLMSRGEIDAAIAFLANAETANGPWQPYEIESLRWTGAWILFNSYRLDAFVTYIDAWEQAHPGKVSYQGSDMYLSALIMLDREPRAVKLVEEWLVAARKEKLEPGDIARVTAAIRHAMGHGYNLYHDRFDERLSAVLAETALYLADHKQASHLVGQILQYNSFVRTDEALKVRTTLYGRLQTQVPSLPARKIAEFISWLRPYGFVTDEGDAGWQKILDSVYERWLKEPVPQDKQVLAGVLLGHGRTELRLKCLRQILADAGTPAEKARALENLFNALLAEPWKAETQAELLALFPRLASAPETPKKVEVDLAIRVVALQLLADWMTNSHAAATVAALPGINELPRRKVNEARAKALKEAREETVRVLAGMETNADLATLRPWLAVERVYQQVKLSAAIAPLETEVHGLLTSAMEAAAKKKPEEVTLPEEILIRRCVATLSWLAVRARAEAGSPADPAVLATIDAAIRDGGEVIDWREAKYVLLAVLDRGDALEAALLDWYGEKREFAKLRWGIGLAMIEAERGRVKEAVGVLEELRTMGELSANDLKTLSDWYIVLDDRNRSREARIQSWQSRDEWEIQNWLQTQVYKYQRSGDDVPSEMDPEVPLAFLGLFRKAAWPGNYTWTLQSFYQATRDFRLLECIPEAVIGQSSQQIYPFLSGLRSVTDSIQEEATLDRLKKHLASLHSSSTHDVNRRALRLLEFMVERRATEQSHGTGPHADAALAALKEAFKLKWEEGEPQMMAGFLASQGGLTPAALADEQLRELKELYGMAPGNPEARFVIGGHLATAQWANRRQREAIVTLEGVLGEYRQANQGVLPVSANSLLGTYASFLQSVGDYRAAEKVWLDELAGNPNEQQKTWMKQSLYQLYASALSSRAEVSLGKGPALYAAVTAQLIAEIQEHTNENHLHNLASTLGGIWLNCHRDLKYPGVGADVRKFAFDTLPPVLNQYNYRNAQGVISMIADRLHDIVDVVTALEFLVVRAETEPAWLRLQGQGFWNQHGYLVARYRSEAGKLSQDLESRLLTIVLRELREDLRSMNARNRSIYSIPSGEFWTEKQGDFARTAHEVLVKYDRSEAHVLYVAQYLYYDLHLYGDAIEALLAAHRRELLGLNGRHRLCDYLQQQNRHAESIPILVPMIAQAPDALTYRVLLMRAYFHTGEAALLDDTLKQADAHFHKDGRWTESAIATLGHICLETRLFRACLAYMDEAIALHVKSAPNRGVGDGTLSQYYRAEAGAWSGLGDTDKAVDAAAGAILSWGRNIHGRQNELSQLAQVLREAKDLDAYVKRLDAVVKETGLENPIVRKALGQTYFEKGQYEQAASELQRAVDVQPNDVESHRLLIEAWDRMGAKDRATAQLLESAKLTGHSVELYKDLGKRYEQLEQPENAERAFTNLVEMMPQESESHQALAEVRKEQKRWEEEAGQWRHVIRIRSREPIGYLGLVRSLISSGDLQEARAVVEKVIATDWPSRFDGDRNTARELLSEIERAGR